MEILFISRVTIWSVFQNPWSRIYMHIASFYCLIYVAMDTDAEFLSHGAVIGIACAGTLIITAIVTFILTYVIVRRCCNTNGKQSSLRLSYESARPLSYTANERTDLEMQNQVFRHNLNSAAND